MAHVIQEPSLPMQTLLIFVAAAILPSLLAVVSAADLYVSPTGDDSAPGIQARPLRTLRAARDRLRPRLAAMDRDLIVMLRGGAYYLAETFSLTPADSGRNGFSVVYRACPGERPELIGGRPVTGWVRDRGEVWKASVPEGWRFEQLFCNGQRMTKARHPTRGYFEVEAAVEADPLRSFAYKAEDIPPWNFGPEAQVFVWASYDWFSSQLPVASINYHQRIITLAGTPLGNIVRRAHRRYFIQGVREALDSPGEWFLDTTESVLYFWPPGDDVESLEIVAPTLTRVVELKGASPDEPVRHVRLEGLRVSVSRFGPEFVETRGTHGRTPWNEPANKEAAVYLEHAEHCKIQDCEVAHAGYNAIALVWGARHNAVTGCHIHDAGFHGVLLSGYRSAFGTKMDHNRDNRVDNNWIHHCGRLVGHGGGVFIWASGHNSIAHNLIHNMPRYGVCLKGERWGGKYGRKIGDETVTKENHWDFVHSRDNCIEFNHIHTVNEDTEDSGFVSTWGSGKGNVIHHNLIRHCRRELKGLSMGIYLDDAADHWTVTQNVVCDIRGGAPGRCFCIYAKGIHNVIENNVLVGEELTGGAIRTFAMADERADHHTYRRNIIYLTGPATCAFGFQNWSDDRVAGSDHNLFFSQAGQVTMLGIPGEDTYANWRAILDGKFDQHSLVADPLFVDPDSGDFRLRPDSPARRLGIVSIDVSKCGLRPGHRFARRP